MLAIWRAGCGMQSSRLTRIARWAERIVKQFTDEGMEDYVSGIHIPPDGDFEPDSYDDPHIRRDTVPDFVKRDNENWEET